VKGLRLASRLAALATVAGLVLTGCGGGNIESTGTQAAGECEEELNMAINPWVGYEASAHVVGYVAKQKLGCEVEYLPLKEELAWQGFGTGEVDVVIENWGHADLKQKYIQGQQTAVRVGATGNTGIIGWYVPPWLAEAHPDVLHWQKVRRRVRHVGVRAQGPAARR
jgi:glycine betaine/proline transport system substrate-binding protein